MRNALDKYDYIIRLLLTAGLSIGEAEAIARDVMLTGAAPVQKRVRAAA